MTPYKYIINAIRNAALIANPTGRFSHGRVVDASQNYDGLYPYIVLYPFNFGLPNGTVNDGATVAKQVAIGFWQQDSPDSSEIEREDIIEAMALLAASFCDTLALDESIADVVCEPQYQFYNGTLSGVAITLTIYAPVSC